MPLRHLLKLAVLFGRSEMSDEKTLESKEKSQQGTTTSCRRSGEGQPPGKKQTQPTKNTQPKKNIKKKDTTQEADAREDQLR